MAAWDDGRGKCEFANGDANDTASGAGGEKTARNMKKWGACKPWRGARCRLYHEHTETEICRDVFLGR
jgi:hypothetical protein